MSRLLCTIRRQALSLRGGARIPFGPVLSIGETGSVLVLYAGVCASLIRLRKLRPTADALMLGSESLWRGAPARDAALVEPADQGGVVLVGSHEPASFLFFWH